MPSDSIRVWPTSYDKSFEHPGNTVSAYDDTRAPWSSTHEQTWKVMKKYDFLSGMFIWTGFDYLGEPTPYSWPSRSSYFGIVDLAGFPKDVYYMYQSEWTNKTVLHIFPYWNWTPGQLIDVWAYYGNADEVELYLNGKSLGVKKKVGDDLHVMWRVPYEPGTLKAISRKDGKVVLTREIHTAGAPAKIELSADRKVISADGKDLSYITVKILDKDGNVVPNADNLVKFKIKPIIARHFTGWH
jgi:beta-galactosidase